MATEFGYAGKILRVDLSAGRVADIPTMDYAGRFLGGRGIAAKIFWDEVPPEARAFDPENRLIFITGPLAGLPDIAGSRWQICSKTAAMAPAEHFSFANLGADWGAQLKFGGYDGIVVQGKSDKPVYLFLHNGVTEVRDASHLWGKGGFEVREALRSELGSASKVVTIGPAGENRIVFASVLADKDSVGAGGLGAVMGSKGLKAIAVAGGSGRVSVAHPEKLWELSRYICQLKRGPTWQPRGAPFIPGSQYTVCYGCIGCGRTSYKGGDDHQGKFTCQAPSFYQPADSYAGLASRTIRYNADTAFRATKLCDDYGLDLKSMIPILVWLANCSQAGILTDKSTGLPLSQMGGLEFIEALVRQISLRQGFGDILAQGLLKAIAAVGGDITQQLPDFPVRAGTKTTGDPRMFMTTGLIHMIEPRTSFSLLHRVYGVVATWVDWVEKRRGAFLSSDVLRAMGRKFYGSELAFDFSTFEGKALAAKMIQDSEYAKECLILCDSFWPINHDEYTADHLGDTSLESKLVSAVTGQEMDENELYRLGEKVFNLQRAILVREGHRGRQDDTLPETAFTVPLRSDTRNDDCLVPGKNGEVISKKGAVLDREKFEKLKGEYYALRGWDIASGWQTRATLNKLGLQDIAQELESRGLIAEALKTEPIHIS